MGTAIETLVEKAVATVAMDIETVVEAAVKDMIEGFTTDSTGYIANVGKWSYDFLSMIAL